MCSAVVSAQDVEQTRRRREALEKDISILRSQISSAASKSEQALNTISLIQAQKASRQKLIAESDRNIARLNSEITEVRRDIARQQAMLDTLQTHYSALVLGAYKNRDIKIWFMYILSSENMSQAFRRFAYFKSLSSQIRVQAEKIEKAREQLDARKSDLTALRTKEQAARNRKAAELERLKEDERSQKALVAKLKKDSKAYSKSLQAKQSEKKALDRQLSKMLSEASSGSGSKTSKKPKVVDVVLDRSFEKNKGKLPWPVDGPVTEHYGAYRNKELQLSLFNNGINIACEKECPVKAVFDGVVSNIMIAPGYGQCILIQHGSYYTSYCKVKTAFVRQGDNVTTGQVIGEVATIMGRTQLYFLVWKKQYLDPEKWLRER